MTTKNETTLSLGERAIILTRNFDAPRELVFEAWTEKEHIEKWFGPKIFRAEAECEPKVGGVYNITMIGTEQAPPEHSGPYPMTGFFKEFIRPERISFTQDLHSHPQDWKDMLKGMIKNYSGENYLLNLTTVLFEEIGAQTKVTIIAQFENDGVRDAFIGLGMKEGWAESLEKLEVLLSLNSESK